MSEVFVFGSKREGRHGKGAALTARQRWGAVYGQATGRQGNSYAIVTKELRRDWPRVTLSEVRLGVEEFIEYAWDHGDTTFLVSPVGCGLAGFTPDQIAPMFEGAPHSVVLPTEFERKSMSDEYKKYDSEIRVEFIGARLTKDAEVRDGANGKMVRLTVVATSKAESDSDLWLEVNVQDSQAELAAHLKKGDTLHKIEGFLTLRKYA